MLASLCSRLLFFIDLKVLILYTLNTLSKVNVFFVRVMDSIALILEKLFKLLVMIRVDEALFYDYLISKSVLI